MSEHLPSTLPAPESLPATPDVDPETIDEINLIEEPIDTRVTSKWAIRLEITAEKVGSFLEDRAINKAHKEALNEDQSRKAQAQDEAYDSYTENVDVVKERESNERSQERREKAKKLFNKIGNASLSFLESQGIIPPRGEWHKQGKGKLNMNFSAWIARKYVAAKERRDARTAGFLSDEQNEAIMGEPELIDTEADDTAAEIKEPAPDKDTVSESPAPEPDEKSVPEVTESETKATTKSEKETGSDEERALAAREKATERAAAAAERRERRRERVKNVSERAKNIVQKLKLGKLGKGALALLGRARASASAAATAWMDFGRE